MMKIYDSKTQPQSTLGGKTLKLGTYELDFDVALLPMELLPIPEAVRGKEIRVNGKLIRIESLRYTVADKTLFGVKYGVGFTTATLRVKVLENPIPLLGFILAVGALLGAAALLCREVRLLVVENPVVGAGLGIGIIVLIGIGAKKLITGRLL